MDTYEVTTTSATETKKISGSLASELVHSHTLRSTALVVALEGDLGGGKTTFTQGFIRGLGVHTRVLSPTFVLMKRYPLPSGFDFTSCIHIDAYRLDHPDELLRLGWREWVKDPNTLIVVEWADRVKKLIPDDAIHIRFEFVDETTRKIFINVKLKNQTSK